MDDLPGHPRPTADPRADPCVDPRADPRLAGTPVSRLAHAAPARRTGHIAGRQVVTLTCFRFTGILDRLVQIGSMAGRKWAFSGLAGLGFARMMGTGTGEGFDPAPNTAV
ncbi:MAG: hypothetical protein AAF698_04835, partial [Pseudomonadota bacterium]